MIISQEANAYSRDFSNCSKVFEIEYRENNILTFVNVLRDLQNYGQYFLRDFFYHIEDCLSYMMKIEVPSACFIGEWIMQMPYRPLWM